MLRHERKIKIVVRLYFWNARVREVPFEVLNQRDMPVQPTSAARGNARMTCRFEKP